MGCLWSRPDIETANRRFRILKKIADGGFSEVFLVVDMDSDDKLAMKRISTTDEEDVEKIKWEIDMHRLHRHANIVPLECYARPEENVFCLLFPFYGEGSLAQLLEKRRPKSENLSHSQVMRILTGVCEALRLLHADSIAHRDIKPANVMLTPEHVPKLTDFGSSAKMPILISSARESQMRQDEAAQHCSMPYRAPEMFACEIGVELTTAVDVWSLGCLLYALLFSVSPYDLVYEAGNSIALATQSPHTIPYPADSPHDSRLVELIKQLLIVDPQERPTIESTVAKVEEIAG